MTALGLRAGSIRLALVATTALVAAAVPALAQDAPAAAPQESRPQSRAFDRVFSGAQATAEQGRFLMTVFEGQDSIEHGSFGDGLPDGTYLGINPSVSLRFGARSGVFVSGTSDVRRYADTADFQMVNGSAAFGAQVASRRSGLRVQQTVGYVPYQQFFATTSPGLSPFSGVAGDGTIADRAGRARPTTMFTTSVNAAHQLSRWVVLTGVYDNIYRHLGPATDLADTMTDTMVHNVSARLNRQIGRHTVLFAGYGTRVQTLTSPGVEPLRSHDISVGLDRSQQLSLFRKTTLNFSTGSSILRVTDGHRLVLTGMATLRHELTRTWVIDLTANRGVNYLEGVRQPVVANTTYVRTSGHLVRRTDLFAQGGYSKGVIGVAHTNGDYSVYSTSVQVRTRVTDSVGVYGEWNGYRQQNAADGLAGALARDIYRQGFRVGVLLTMPIQSEKERPVIPGKKYAPEELLAIAWDRKWLVLVCVAAGAAAALAYGRTLPKRFTSETVVMLLPQRVAENVAPASRLIPRVEERLRSMPQRITSRARLERAIADFNLYAGSDDCRTLDEKVECLRKDTDARIVGSDTFKIAYTAADPQLTMHLVERLSNEVRQEVLDESKADSTKNLAFIEESLVGARKQLEEQEKKVEVYRKTYAGELPDQLPSNQQILQSTQLQLQNLGDSLSADRDRRLRLNQDLGNELSAEAQPETPAMAQRRSEEAAPAAFEQLARQNEDLKALRARGYTEQHPDVIAARKNIRLLEQQIAQAPKRSEEPVAPTVTVSPRAMAREERIRGLRKELDTTDRQIVAKQLEERRLQGITDQVRRRIDATPTRESELTALTRDYQTINSVYTGRLAQRESAMVTVRAGEQNELFKVLDPPREPRRPSSPDMPRVVASGCAIGLMLALALVALFEYRNSTLRDEDEVTACTGLPVIAVIPMMTSAPSPGVKRLFGLPGAAGPAPRH